MNDEQRKIIVNFRATPTEKKMLQEKAEQARMSLSAYVMALAENKKITVAEKIPELVYEIAKIGTNVNQIAHVANSQKFVNPAQLENVLSMLEITKNNTQKILSELYNENEHSLSGIERKIENLKKEIKELSSKIEK